MDFSSDSAAILRSQCSIIVGNAGGGSKKLFFEQSRWS